MWRVVIAIIACALAVGMAGCAKPSQVSQGAIQTAIAQTRAAEPTQTQVPTQTPTEIPTQTPTPIPTNTSTPQPTGTPTPSPAALMLSLNRWMRMTNTAVEVVDVTYTTNVMGEKGILLIKSKCTSETCTAVDVHTASLFFLAKGSLARDNIAIDESVFAVNVIAYDSKLQSLGSCAMAWSDIVDFSKDRITPDQFALRITSP